MSFSTDSSRLNLTAANHVFLIEPQWNPMVEDQAFDRVHRIGQTKEVTTVRYIVKNTLEEVHLFQYPGPIFEMPDLIFAQSIRHQQTKKRNLAEQAFALDKGHKDWIEVSKHSEYQNRPSSIDVYSESGLCSLMYRNGDTSYLIWQHDMIADLEPFQGTDPLLYSTTSLLSMRFYPFLTFDDTNSRNCGVQNFRWRPPYYSSAHLLFANAKSTAKIQRLVVSCFSLNSYVVPISSCVFKASKPRLRSLLP